MDLEIIAITNYLEICVWAGNRNIKYNLSTKVQLKNDCLILRFNLYFTNTKFALFFILLIFFSSPFLHREFSQPLFHFVLEFCKILYVCSLKTHKTLGLFPGIIFQYLDFQQVFGKIQLILHNIYQLDFPTRIHKYTHRF